MYGSIKESDYGIVLAEHFAADHAVFYEVQMQRAAGRRADIVLAAPGYLHVIEIKKSLSLALLSQAIYWRPYAKYVSIGIPEGKRGHWNAVLPCIAAYGLGVYAITHPWYGKAHGEVKEVQSPELRGTNENQLRDSLHELQKTYSEPGNADNRYVTPFKLTTMAILAHIQENGPTPIAKLAKIITHHYDTNRSFRAGVANAIRWKLTPEISRLNMQKIRGQNVVVLRETPELSSSEIALIFGPE